MARKWKESFLKDLDVVGLSTISYYEQSDCRWEITAYDSASKDAQLWIPTDTKQRQQPPLITSIKSMSSEPLSVQLYLEHPSLSVPKPQEGKNS